MSEKVNKRKIGIYKITNPEGHCYIGYSSDIEKRFKTHKNKTNSVLLKNSFDTYGIENHKFEILEECKFEELIIRENFYIDYYKNITTLFNSITTAPNTIKHQTIIQPSKGQSLLNNLKAQTGLVSKDLAEKLGVKLKTLNYQLLKDETVDETIKYMNQLGIKEVVGIENNVEIKIELIK